MLFNPGPSGPLAGLPSFLNQSLIHDEGLMSVCMVSFTYQMIKTNGWRGLVPVSATDLESGMKRLRQ